MPKLITKSDGTTVCFDKQKVIKTCMRAGASEEVAQRIADFIDRTLPERTSTHKIYRTVLEELERANPAYASLYGLREAIADLDAASFELYAKKVIEAHGYVCVSNQIVRGACVEHQLDIIAKKEHTWFVECKRHFNPHRFCGLDVPLEVQARLEDLRDGWAQKTTSWNFDGGAWIFTNAKLSEHAKRYANAKGIRLTGWGSGELGLERLVERTVFPVTALHADLMTKATLLRAGIITLQDMLAAKTAPVPNWPELIAQAHALLKR